MIDFIKFIFMVPYLMIKDIIISICNKIYDRRIWKDTKYQGMKFTLESTWNNYDKTYASPVFVFENGNRVVIDKRGNIVEL